MNQLALTHDTIMGTGGKVFINLKTSLCKKSSTEPEHTGPLRKIFPVFRYLATQGRQDHMEPWHCPHDSGHVGIKSYGVGEASSLISKEMPRGFVMCVWV